MRPLLKICGLMREEDVELCCRKGVDICGFVTEYTVPVPWNMDRERTAHLLAEVRGRAGTCIVSGGSLEKLCDLTLRLRPDYIQLHGGETIGVTAALTAELKPLGIRVIKTIPVSADARTREFGTPDPAQCARMLDDAGVYAALVDARGPENAAGTRLHADPGLFLEVRRAAHCVTILGGGVRSENCAALVAALHPAVVDVMTGVEIAPGVKSEAMLDDLLTALNGAASRTEAQ